MWVNLLLKAVLFVLLVPGVLLSIPQGASLPEQALIHGVVFAIVNYYAYLYVLPMLERFDNPDTRVLPPCPAGSVRHGKDCRMKGEGEAPQ